MNPRIFFYSFLCLLWIAVAFAIYFDLHERFLGRSEGWVKNLTIGICLLMSCFNVLRIYMIRRRAARSKQPNDKAF